MSNKPLYDAIKNYSRKTKARFHMPSHNASGEGLYASSNFDVTELDGLDNLMNPTGVIGKAQSLMSRAYKCHQSLFLTQGSTCAIHISLFVAKHFGSKIVAFGTMHNSFWSGCQLAGLEIIRACNLDELNDILQNTACQTQCNNHGVSALFVTSPDYFGNCKDIIGLKKICDKYKILLLVDEAHGAHFAFCDLLPKSCSTFADLTMVSMHKTMPVYGGGALLNIGNKNLCDLALYYRQMIHSSSPSYLIMASMDLARADFEKNAHKYYSKIKNEINKIKGHLGEFCILPSDDFSRLVISKYGCDAMNVRRQLQEKNIFIEMAFEDKLVLIVTPNNFKCLHLLASELKQIKTNSLERRIIDYKPVASGIKLGKPTFIALDNALGKICGKEIGIYPPGTPLICLGDIIDEKIIKIIKENADCIFGLVNNYICVLQ